MIRHLANIAFSCAVTLTAVAVSAAATAPSPRQTLDIADLKAATAKKLVTSARRTMSALPDDAGYDDRYIIQFEGDAVPLAMMKSSQRGNGVRAVTEVPASPVGGMDLQSAEAQQHVSAVRNEQSAMLSRMSAEAGAIEVLRTHQYALNAATVRMSADTARKVQLMDGVRSVERDEAMELTTPSSVPFIGADQLWDGTATGDENLGEGMVVGIIDSGINHDHPSFAATGDDGYTVINPLGEGVYLGDCAAIAGLCNSKLIGAYTFLDSQTSDPADEILLEGDAPSTDTDGHGTHVAGTAAGNVVFDTALPDADGNEGSIRFEQIAGVAPHANVIAYKVCAPSCFTSDIAAAVDQAIADGIVDVLNHSISSGPGSPWASTQATAFLNARAAGIFVANSAGNSGPDAGTAEAAGNAPWVAAVAATTHDRAYPDKLLQDLTGGGTPPPMDITGLSVSGGITGEIVYAGDFPTANGSANDTDPAQCLDPFPAGTFTSAQIVLCDRGAIARTAKGQHVRDGGAGGFILGNTEAQGAGINADAHVIPAIHITSADATEVRAWLATGEGHTGTITPVTTAISDPSAADNLADFSSRGPYTGYDILAPNTAAPGVDIFAAGAELTQEQVDLMAVLYAGTPAESPAVRGSYGAIGGTSMSSPHIAGSAALLKQAHPEWSDAEVLSAIMTTGTWDLVKEDGVTAADPFDFGGGRVQLALAVNAGLLLDESSANFEAADPALDGNPSELNVAGLVNRSCVLECSWTRVVKATEGGSWTTSTSNSAISVSPASFSLAAGETQSLTVTANSASLPAEEWAHARVNLLPADGPEQHLTVSLVPSVGSVPSDVSITAARDADSFLVEGIESIAVSDLQVAVGGLVAPTITELSLDQDSDNSSPYDDLSDGVDFILVPTSEGEIRFVAFTQDATSESPDLDLFVGFDANGNGLPDAAEEICVSATASAAETCDISGTVSAGSFWVLVQNWQASGTPPDSLILNTALVGGDEGNLSVEAPSSVPELTPFDIRLTWDLPASEVGDVFFGTVTLGSDSANADNIGVIPVTITRGEDDVVYSVDSENAVPGDTLTFSIEVAANLTPDDRNYEISAEIPDGFTLVPGSITGGGTASGSVINWNVAKESLAGASSTYEVTTSNEDAACAVPFANRGGYLDLEQLGILPDSTITGDTVTFTAFGAQNFNFYGETLTSGLNFTDDGFAFFSPATPGPLPFVNLPIPSDAEPNNLLAILWKDFIIPPSSSAPGSVAGVSLATAGSNLSLLEYDNLEAWPGGGGDSIDIELAIFGAADDSPGAYEIVFAFDNVNSGSSTGTIGVEDAAGTSGTQYAFNDVAVTDGLAVCFDLVGPAIAPTALSYQVTVEESAEDSIVTSSMSSSVDAFGTETVEETVDVEVAVAPLRGDVNGDGVVDRADVMQVLMTRNVPITGPDDPRDMNGDGVIDVLDSRLVTLACDLPGCATPEPPPPAT